MWVSAGGALTAALVLIALLAGAQPATSSSTLTVPFALGIATGASPLAATRAQVDSTMAGIAAAGGQWVRFDVVWNNVEAKPDRYSWGPEDRAIEAARAKGLHVDAIIDYAPSWAKVDGQPDPIAYASFAAATAERYSRLGVETYEIWNEENLASSWGDQVDPMAYGTLLKASYEAIKAVDPNAIVLLGGLGTAQNVSNGESISPYSFLSDLYSLGFGAYFDAANVHPYSFPDFPATADSWNPFWQLPQYHELMASYGYGDKQIWITEFGAPTGTAQGDVSESTQAAMISQAIQMARSWSWAGPFFVYDWRDGSGQTFGLLRRNGSAKPSLAAFEGATGLAG